MCVTSSASYVIVLNDKCSVHMHKLLFSVLRTCGST
jgi:hypothetical protein